MDLRFFVMDAAAPSVASPAIEHEPAWKSISWFELRFYHLHDDIERNIPKGSLMNTGLIPDRNSWITSACCDIAREKWKIPTIVRYPLSPFSLQKGKRLGYFWKEYTILGNRVSSLNSLLPLPIMETRK